MIRFDTFLFDIPKTSPNIAATWRVAAAFSQPFQASVGNLTLRTWSFLRIFRGAFENAEQFDPNMSELFQFELQADQSCTCHHQSHLIAVYLVGFLSTGTCDHRWSSGIFQWSKQTAGMKWMSWALLINQQLLCNKCWPGRPLWQHRNTSHFKQLALFEGCLQSYRRTCHLQFYLIEYILKQTLKTSEHTILKSNMFIIAYKYHIMVCKIHYTV